MKRKTIMLMLAITLAVSTTQTTEAQLPITTQASKNVVATPTTSKLLYESVTVHIVAFMTYFMWSNSKL